MRSGRVGGWWIESGQRMKGGSASKLPGGFTNRFRADKRD
jgi:hypothetical protein